MAAQSSTSFRDAAAEFFHPAGDYPWYSWVLYYVFFLIPVLAIPVMIALMFAGVPAPTP